MIFKIICLTAIFATLIRVIFKLNLTIPPVPFVTDVLSTIWGWLTVIGFFWLSYDIARLWIETVVLI